MPAADVEFKEKLRSLSHPCRTIVRVPCKLTPDANPPHPTISWEIEELRGRRWFVQVTCPTCGQERMVDAGTTRQRVRQGTFTGKCEQCRNSALGGWNKGVPCSPEAIEKLRLREFSDETRAKMREARARQVLTPQTRARLSAVRQGRKLSPEHVAKLSGPNHYRWRGGAKRVFDDAWRELRLQVLERDGFTCQHCWDEPAVSRLIAHHIVEVEDGGPDTMDNLLTLCRGCHVAHHSREAKRKRDLMESVLHV